MSTLSTNVDYREIYKSFPDMCLSLETTTGRIISFNQTLLDVLGYTAEEVKNATLFDLYADSEVEKVKDNLRSIKASRVPNNTEFVVQKKNGEIIDVTLKLSFVRDEQGRVLYSNAVWRDISALKKVERELLEAKKELEEKNQLISEQNKNFVDTINYAQNIQGGMLPSPNEVQQAFPKSFIYYQPKGIVSGDFYWLFEREDHVLFSVVDCTGHGVPGALMSMVGNALFDQVVMGQHEFCSDVIMNKVRAGLIKVLKQGHTYSTNSDGMDAGFCVYNRKSRLLEFSGANSKLIVLRENGNLLMNKEGESYSVTINNGTHTLYEISGQKQPLGYYMGMGILFEKQEIQLQAGDRLFLFSDGYSDQIGGEKGKKYLSKRFRAELLSTANGDIDKQGDMLKTNHEIWKGMDNEQTDDICVWGVEIE